MIANVEAVVARECTVAVEIVRATILPSAGDLLRSLSRSACDSLAELDRAGVAALSERDRDAALALMGDVYRARLSARRALASLALCEDMVAPAPPFDLLAYGTALDLGLGGHAVDHMPRTIAGAAEQIRAWALAAREVQT